MSRPSPWAAPRAPRKARGAASPPGNRQRSGACALPGAGRGGRGGRSAGRAAGREVDSAQEQGPQAACRPRPPLLLPRLLHPSALRARRLRASSASWQSILLPDPTGRRRRRPDLRGPQIQRPTRSLGGGSPTLGYSVIWGDCFSYLQNCHFPLSQSQTLRWESCWILIFKTIP